MATSSLLHTAATRRLQNSAMAENPARRRRRNPEDEEVAVAVQQRGAPNQWALWRDGNSNYSGPAQMTRFERDSKIILKLQNSGLVLHPHLLCSFRTPVAILGQGDRIDPLNAAILDILNNMAVSRRLVLEYKLRRKSNAAEAQEHQRKLTLWRGEILQLQSKIEGLAGRYLRIPPVLLTPLELQE